MKLMMSFACVTEQRANYSDIVGDFELPEFSASQRLGTANIPGDLADRNTSGPASLGHHHTDSSRDNLNASVNPHSGISDSVQGNETADQGPLQLDLDSIVIKQEVGDNVEDSDDDVSFTGESLEGQMQYPGPLPVGVPPGGGNVPLSQVQISDATVYFQPWQVLHQVLTVNTPSLWYCRCLQFSQALVHLQMDPNQLGRYLVFLFTWHMQRIWRQHHRMDGESRKGS